MKNPIRFFSILTVLSVMITLVGCGSRKGKPRVLVFSKTAGYRHASIEVGKPALIELGKQNNFDVDTTEDANYFTEDSLKNYSAVIFLNTTMDVLNNYQEADFERYIQAGGGFVGIHSATDTEYDWGWYGRLVGGYFNGHPETQQAKLMVTDATHISTKHLPTEWVRTDEWYNFKKLNKDVHVLLKIDEQSYKGGTNGADHPMAWYHEFDGGRSFYTELGHTNESWTEENFLKHVLGGIQYAIGDNKELSYAKSKTNRVPEEDRFTKTMLTQGTLFEPTEMTILPNLDILIAQRRGEIMRYRKQDGSVKQVGSLNTYWKAEVPDVNAEEGVMGLQADPNFEKNRFIYIYYSPKDTSVNRLSRFTYENDTISTTSEKIILELYSQRNICCHTGGSIAFGNDRILFLSTGDNSTPFDEPNQKYVNHGFAPLNDAPGHLQYDARRSSANTNDLRGKILRIKVNEDGTYEVPDGNLFPKGTANTRPEIYVMGNRNPYRISVDKKTGFLYWGEVGPDSPKDSLDTRGPKGYDEVNQARKAGYFGWPLFVGNNYPYRNYDYTTGKSGESFDPARPLNSSRNNTGLQNLPPAQPAFIWYPYDSSPEFPQVGTGGRNAMAGPIYYEENFPEKTRLPHYYNNKLFIYDWIRGWVKAVTMLPNGDFDKMEPFMPNMKLNSPIDMEMGPDGQFYILEYGSGWFSKNPDAGLARIDYNSGNRAPKVGELAVNKTSGSLPFKITATVEAKDPEREQMKYEWHLGDVKKETTEPTIEHTFEKPGENQVYVEVIDADNARAKSEILQIYAGNEAPMVDISIQGNQTFYFPGKPVQYAVTVTDKDDPSASKDLTSLVVTAEYTEGGERPAVSQGHQVLTEAMLGKNLTLSLDCKTCHKVSEKSIGPSYQDVAKKYEKDVNATPYLVNKIIKGGAGVWGEVAMPAHPDLPETDAKQMVAYIQSLLSEGKTKPTLPPAGSVPANKKPSKENTNLFLSASYTDKGGNNIRPLTSSNIVMLRNSKMGFESVKRIKEFQGFDLDGARFMIVPNDPGWFVLDSIDLSGVVSAQLRAGWQKPPQTGYTFELRLDSPDGKLIGTIDLPLQKSGNGVVVTGRIDPLTDGKLHDLYLVSKPKKEDSADQVGLQWIEFKL
jgi:glucose/arabinose dehydrogenase/cytochrome c551/c552